MMPERLLSLLAAQEAEMFSLLRQLVLIQSGSRNKEGVDRVARVIEEFLVGLPVDCERHARQRYGDHLVFATGAAKHKKYILISGHMDTVFPRDTDFNWYREEGNRVFGPGVIDMKGGLVVTLFAVRALAEAGLLHRIPLKLFFNSDEEVGSPSSVALVEELARGAVCGLVTECGGKDGQVVTARSGKTGYRLDVYGRAGHAASAGLDKASAVLELCRLVPELEALNDVENGLVINVGRIEGGVGPNSVAEHGHALIDSRYCSTAQGRRLRQAIETIVARSEAGKGTRVELTVTHSRPVMPRSAANRQMYGVICAQAERLGIRISEEQRSGVSDGSNIAGQGVPVVDGLGPVGEHDHSNREYLLKESLLQRCKLLASSTLSLNEVYCNSGEPVN